MFTRFPSVLLKPLGHPSTGKGNDLNKKDELKTTTAVKKQVRLALYGEKSDISLGRLCFKDFLYSAF
jgi:hypothetical protein